MRDVVYEFLHKPKYIKNDILKLRAKRADLKSRLELSGVSYDGVQVQSSKSDQIAETFASIDEIERQIKELTGMLDDHMKKMEKAINQIEDDNERTVLITHYVGGFPMEIIAYDMGYAVPTVYKFNRLGCRRLETIIESV